MLFSRHENLRFTLILGKHHPALRVSQQEAILRGNPPNDQKGDRITNWGYPAGGKECRSAFVERELRGLNFREEGKGCLLNVPSNLAEAS
jgi:hypothetical protein